MDRQFDFRALLLKIQDRLSSDDRRRLHFLMGDIVPRMQRDDTTLGGTLTLFESLFDRAIITEEYLDFLIRIFREIQCYDAVKRLQEYQLSKQPSKLTSNEPPPERKLTVSDVFDDNTEEDKYPTAAYESLISRDNNFPSVSKSDVRKTTITEAPPVPAVVVKSKPTPKQFFKSRLTLCLYALFLCQILILLIYLWIFFRRKPPVQIIKHRFRQNVYILKNGKSFDDIDGKLVNHAENLSLTFADRLTRIDTYFDPDDLYSIKFIYSQNKSIEHKFRNITRWHILTLSSLDCLNQTIEQITQCYETNNGFKRLVGLRFGLKDKPVQPFGPCPRLLRRKDAYSNHIFGYALGKTVQYLHGFEFVWYKICPLYNEVISCVENIFYALPLNLFYKD